MKKITKFLSVLMAVVMLVTVLCVPVSAASAPASPDSAYAKAKLVDSGSKMSFTLKHEEYYDDGTGVDYGIPRIYKVELAKAGTLKIDVTSAVSMFHVQVLDEEATEWMSYSDYTVKTGSFVDTYDNGPWIRWDESLGKAKFSVEYKLKKGTYFVRIFSCPDAVINGKTTVKFTYPQAEKNEKEAEITSLSISLEKGDKLQLGTILSGEGDVTWSSSKKSVATVSSKGKVTAKGTGTAVITAKTGDSAMKITIKVAE